jgi:peptidoglycan hydrolase CwlO-like protein
MKKLIKKFWWIPVVLLSLGSLAFGTISTVNNFQLKEEIAVVQQANEELEQEKQALEVQITEKDAKIGELNKEITELKKK